MFFGHRQFAQQVLQKAKGTKKATDQPSPKHAEQQQKAADIKTESITGRSSDCLQRAQRAGQGGCRAGITIQPRCAQIFGTALVEPAGSKIQQFLIGKHSREQLHKTAVNRTGDFHRFTPILCIPYTRAQPFAKRSGPHRATAPTVCSRLPKPAAGSGFCPVWSLNIPLNLLFVLSYIGTYNLFANDVAIRIHKDGRGHGIYTFQIL